MITLREGGTYVGPPYTPIQLPMLGETSMTDVIFCPWCRDLFIQADIAGLQSPASITIVVEGSLDNVGWDDLQSIIDPSVAPTPIVISSNGCTIMKFTGALTPYVKARIIGATGVLADATIALQAYMQSIS